MSKEILSITSGRCWCCLKATKGFKGNKRLIQWFKARVKELINARK